MTDQTPSTEDVRYGYRTGVTAPILPIEAGDAFDAWLAAHDRETAAKALREAAAAVGGAHGPRGGVRMDDEVEWTQWLNALATRIGAGHE